MLGIATLAPLIFMMLVGSPKEHSEDNALFKLVIAVVAPGILDLGIALMVLRGKDVAYYLSDAFVGVAAGVPTVYLGMCGSFFFTGAIAFVLGLRWLVHRGSLDRLSVVRAWTAVGGAACIPVLAGLASFR
jgi:hypothetical protein